VEQYRQRLSGPLLDRIDIHLAVPRLSRAELLGSGAGEASSAIRQRVEAARELQRTRLSTTPWTCNAQVPGATARTHARFTGDAEALLSTAVDSMSLSGRGFDRAVRVARTIADLDGSERVAGGHMAEALAYRSGPVLLDVVAGTG
jgi:magnesium chelatase family protein